MECAERDAYAVPADFAEQAKITAKIQLIALYLVDASEITAKVQLNLVFLS